MNAYTNIGRKNISALCECLTLKQIESNDLIDTENLNLRIIKFNGIDVRCLQFILNFIKLADTSVFPIYFLNEQLKITQHKVILLKQNFIVLA